MSHIDRSEHLSRLIESQATDAANPMASPGADMVCQTDLRAAASRSHDLAEARRDVIESIPSREPDPAELDWDEPTPKILTGAGRPWTGADVGYSGPPKTCPGCGSRPLPSRLCLVCHATMKRPGAIEMMPRSVRVAIMRGPSAPLRNRTRRAALKGGVS